MGNAGSLAITPSPHQPDVSAPVRPNRTWADQASTNAIKFTKDRPRSAITVTIGGSWSRPPRCWQDVTFTDDEPTKTEITDNPEWGNGRKAYLWLKVTDTGCGMTLEEQKKLFSRFSQATPRTHVKYGKSKDHLLSTQLTHRC
jgi:hypothetical protein